MQKEQSFHHFHLQHFCPVAQTLERVGDRWSWLIVRDLMRGPKRFTDLQRYLAGITAKRLTVNLRTLESEGIVEREREPGRREVWYRLTAKGKGLVPVIKALAAWGLEYNLRGPLPGETVYPEHMMPMLSIYLNQRGRRLPEPVKVSPTDAPDADVRIETTPATWATFVLSRSQEERQRLLSAMRISGEQSRVNELLAINWIEKQPEGV